jgi:hypothetical protein
LKIQLITFRGTNLMLTPLLTGDLDYAPILPFLTGVGPLGPPAMRDWSFAEKAKR